ncbi:MAG: serine protease [Desulfatibacillaceae bacterium]
MRGKTPVRAALLPIVFFLACLWAGNLFAGEGDVLLARNESSVASADAGGLTSQGKTSFFNQKWLAAVVSLEILREDADPKPVGTGFLVRTPDRHILLVTTKHVILGRDGKLLEGLAYRLNDLSGKSILVEDAPLRKQGLGGWFLAPEVDIACRFIGWRRTSEIAAIPLDAFLSYKDVQAGTPLLVLGFPLGLRATDHANPIARKGMAGRSGPKNIVADVQVFPGNSGGPVVYYPPVKVGSALSTPLINEERFVGVVQAFIPYVEPAVGAHTGRTRVVFEENSGLAKVIPADLVHALVTSPEVRAREEKLPRVGE